MSERLAALVGLMPQSQEDPSQEDPQGGDRETNRLLSEEHAEILSRFGLNPSGASNAVNSTTQNSTTTTTTLSVSALNAFSGWFLIQQILSTTMPFLFICLLPLIVSVLCPLSDSFSSLSLCLTFFSLFLLSLPYSEFFCEMRSLMAHNKMTSHLCWTVGYYQVVLMMFFVQIVRFDD